MFKGVEIMASSEVNSQAKNNGNWGEQRALPILERIFTDLEYRNDIIDFYAENGIPIEVKTCKFKIGRESEHGRKTLFRAGRFVLDKDQHQILQNQNGFYLFLVKDGDLLVKANLMKAKDLTFTRNISWGMVV